MEIVKSALSENVTTRRNRLDLTQAQLAEASGLSLKMIQKVEYQQAWPSPDTLSKIAQALQCKPWELLKEPSSVSPAETSGLSIEAIGRMLQETTSYIKETKALQALYEDKIKLLEDIIRDQKNEIKALHDADARERADLQRRVDELTKQVEILDLSAKKYHRLVELYSEPGLEQFARIDSKLTRDWLLQCAGLDSSPRPQSQRESSPQRPPSQRQKALKRG